MDRTAEEGEDKRKVLAEVRITLASIDAEMARAGARGDNAEAALLFGWWADLRWDEAALLAELKIRGDLSFYGRARASGAPSPPPLPKNLGPSPAWPLIRPAVAGGRSLPPAAFHCCLLDYLCL